VIVQFLRALLELKPNRRTLSKQRGGLKRGEIRALKDPIDWRPATAKDI
jgi:hypothetical protein